jgi:hypothetical protein
MTAEIIVLSERRRRPRNDLLELQLMAICFFVAFAFEMAETWRVK